MAKKLYITHNLVCFVNNSVTFNNIREKTLVKYKGHVSILKITTIILMKLNPVGKFKHRTQEQFEFFLCEVI